MLMTIINSKSKTFIAFCFSFLAGITLASIFDIGWSSISGYFIFAFIIGLVIILRNNREYKFILLNIILIILAIWRYDIAIPNHSNKYISYYNEQEYEFDGYISAEPDVRIADVRYIVKSEKLKGKVYVKNQLYPRYQYGDRVKIKCSLKSPEAFDGFRYDMYLANMGVFSLCNNASFYQLEGRNGNIVFGQLMKYKNIFAQRVNKLWHEPYASFVAGLLYGYRGGLGELQDHFNRTGITHIVAISGYNISIISIILITLFIRLWVPRKKAFWFILGSIFLFVIFAGASGSVVRAGIMGSLALLSKYVGRTNRLTNSIVLTAVLMTVVNPFVLVWDVGFQLSFLATIGLIYLLPILEARFEKMPQLFSIKTLFLSTISAITLTLPLILYQFGRLSIVAPIVNVLVLWLIPFIMLLGFLSVVLSFVIYPLGQLMAWFAYLGLKYITTITVWFSHLPFSSINLAIPLWLVFLAYIVIFGGIFKLNKR